MTNVTGRTKHLTHHEVSVSNPATRRDVADLLFFADRKYRELNPDDPHLAGGQDLYDDAYSIEARDDELVAVIVAEDK